jgi:hypothetical protein
MWKMHYREVGGIFLLGLYIKGFRLIINNKVLKDGKILFGFLDNNHFSPSSVDRKLPQVQFRWIVLSVVYSQLSFERRLLLC